MRIKDKFEMLEAIGGIDGKYVKKADKLLAERAEIDRQVIKLVPEKRKFSWKTFAAAAASLAVLVTGTAVMVKFTGNNITHVTPNNGLTIEQQEYLNSWKKALGTSVEIAYAVDRLNFTEIKMPEDISMRYFTDENTAVNIDTADVGSTGSISLDTYNILKGTYHLEDVLDQTLMWEICFTEQDYILYHGWADGGKGCQTNDELYLHNVKENRNYLIYVEENESDDIYRDGGMIVADGKVYFTVYSGEKCSVHVYDIDLKRETAVIEDANSPRYYKGDILYNDVSSSALYVRSISGKYNIEGSVIVTDYGLYQLTVGGGLTELESGKKIIPDNSADGIINLDGSCDFALIFGGSRLNSLYAAENALGFIYYAPTNEILVFEDGDGFGQLNGFGWGATISKAEPDGTVREFIVSDKESENNVKIPKFDRDVKLENNSSDLEIPIDPVDVGDPYLNEIKKELNVSDGVGIAYARDRLNVTDFSLPWKTAFAVDSGTLFIDSNHALVSDISLMNKIEMYTLDTKEYTTLISMETDPYADKDTLYDIYYVNSDYIVFSRKNFIDRAELCLIELKKDGYPCTELGDDNCGFHNRMFIDDNTLYYASADRNKPSVYRYDLRLDDEPALYIDEGVPLCIYNDHLLYYTMEEGTPYRAGVDHDETDYNKRILHSTSYEFEFNDKPYTENMWACKYGVFKADGGKLINCLTDEVILSSDHDLPFSMNMQPDFGVVIGNGIVAYIYNANTNELLVFEEDDDVNKIMSWRNCRWGLCRDGGTLISQFETARSMNDRDLSYSDMGIPEVYIPTNADVGHPLNIWLDIDPESISVIKSDDLPYGFTEYVDGDKLRFTVNIAMKENYYEYDTCNMNIDGHDVTIKRGEVARVPMTMDDSGQFSITLLNDIEQIDFGSSFHFVLELDSTLVGEIFYMESYRGERN